MIHELPDELRLERAKIVPTLDGVVYQGPHAFLSNLYAADVDMEVENGETITFNSNEQALAYIYSCAIHHNQHEAAQQKWKLKDPFDVKRSFHKISKKHWVETFQW